MQLLSQLLSMIIKLVFKLSRHRNLIVVEPEIYRVDKAGALECRLRGHVKTQSLLSTVNIKSVKRKKYVFKLYEKNVLILYA